MLHVRWGRWVFVLGGNLVSRQQFLNSVVSVSVSWFTFSVSLLAWGQGFNEVTSFK